MAIKGKLPQGLSIDPAVEAVMGRSNNDPVYGHLSKVKAARNQTKAQRRKAAADSKRNRAMFDLEPEIEQALDWLANENGTSRSQVANYLMLAGLEAISAEVTRNPLLPRRPSRAIRFEFLLEYPELPDAVRFAVERWKRQRTTQP